MPHIAPLSLALSILALPVQAEAPNFTFSTPATETARQTDDLAQFDLPIAAFDGTLVPTRRLEGRLEQRAYRLDGSRDTTLALLQPLRAQLEAAGFSVIFDCDTTACGGFDFRFALKVLPEPEMHVDLGDFRYLAAENGAGEAVSLLISRAPDIGFVQVTSIGPGSGGPVAEQVLPAAPTPEPLEPLPEPLPPPEPEKADIPAPSELARILETTGAAPLDDLVFASGKAVLEPGDYASLSELAAWLKSHPDLKVTLVGHTDASGTLAGNTALSKARAQAVRARLMEDFGIGGDQMDAEGAGYLAPRATNQTPEGRQKNRRVEVMLTSTPVKQ